jgi:signal transduction histidine kinase
MMIASASHDMKTPLNSIINMINLIEKRVDDPILIKWCKVAINSSKLLVNLVNDTLDYFQIKSKKFVKKHISFDLKNLINDCFELVSL